VAVVFFGSRLVGASPGAHSAYDFFVIVEEYAAFYRALRAAGRTRRAPGLQAALNRILPPSVLVLATPAGLDAKCAILSEADLARALSPRARDHFCRGRLVQRVAIVHARSEPDRTRVESALAGARRETVTWVPAYLPSPFTTEAFCRRMLEVSYAQEIRPEAPERVREVFAAQREELIALYEPLLAEAAARGELVRDEAGWRRPAPPSGRERRRWARFFRRSKARATLRWFKYTVTYEGWLDYLIRKAERRTGETIAIGPWERRLPLLLLWPKAIRFLRARREETRP
jgi:hypothetical protein